MLFSAGENSLANSRPAGVRKSCAAGGPSGRGRATASGEASAEQSTRQRFPGDIPCGHAHAHRCNAGCGQGCIPQAQQPSSWPSNHQGAWACSDGPMPPGPDSRVCTAQTFAASQCSERCRRAGFRPHTAGPAWPQSRALRQERDKGLLLLLVAADKSAGACAACPRPQQQDIHGTTIQLAPGGQHCKMCVQVGRPLCARVLLVHRKAVPPWPWLHVYCRPSPSTPTHLHPPMHPPGGPFCCAMLSSVMPRGRGRWANIAISLAGGTVASAADF